MRNIEHFKEIIGNDIRAWHDMHFIFYLGYISIWAVAK